MQLAPIRIPGSAGLTSTAVITYFCGRGVAGTNRSSWSAGQQADLFGSGHLITLLSSLRYDPPAARAHMLSAVLSVQEEMQREIARSRSTRAAAAEHTTGRQQQEAAEAYADEDDAEQVYDAEQEQADAVSGHDAATAEDAQEEEEEEEEEAGPLGLRWDGRQLPQLVLRCHMEGDDVAYHTFFIASRPDLQFDVYQSFIGHYTLHDYLWAHPKPLSYQQMMQFLAEVRELESASKWTRETDKKYHSLFGVSLGRAHGYRGVRLDKGSAGAQGASQPDMHDALLFGQGRDGWQVGRGTALQFSAIQM
ncbi:golgin subfamily B member 1-like [Chlorella sorokiniana]|uniref:Golgin subfamily B member 1-like n=1 Tax=Chlorella sorokiniana TaxID=3076 RepID=A0A2P6U1A2_CHLSO|nr:golgin subfamily B member 1-like [Chlorella sorokiniana]|eukprot:PRW60094.1 golgin subfamily B member 1-like [Chlorella sorokiniana]